MKLLSVTVVVGVVFIGCGAPGPGTESPTASPGTSFSAVMPELASAGCNDGACHGGAQPQEIALEGACEDVYEALFAPRVAELSDTARVELPADKNKPAAAFTARKMVGELGHGGGFSSTISDDVYNSWVWWLADGAQGCE